MMNRLMGYGPMARILVMVVLSAILVVPALASTTGTFDPAAGVTAFKSDFANLLTSLMPFAVGIMLVGIGWKIVTKLMRRGTKV